MLAEYDTVACPKCGKDQPDMDGFGFIACLPDGCGYCTHPCSEKAPGSNEWKCGICCAVLSVE